MKIAFLHSIKLSGSIYCHWNPVKTFVLQGEYMLEYVYVSDQTWIFTYRNQDVDFNMLKMFFSFHCIKYGENRWLNKKLSKKKRRNSPIKTIRLFCTFVTLSVLLCHTAICQFRWDPKWPWAPWQWVGMTFQAFRGSWVISFPDPLAILSEAENLSSPEGLK